MVDEILTVVHDFRELEVASYADPQPSHLARRGLVEYLADPLLSRTLETVDSMHRAGIVFQGRPTWELTVAELRLDDTPPTATVRECVDATDWHSIFRETGDAVPGDRRSDRYVSRLRLKQYPDGWLVYDIEREDGEC